MRLVAHLTVILAAKIHSTAPNCEKISRVQGHSGWRGRLSVPIDAQPSVMKMSLLVGDRHQRSEGHSNRISGAELGQSLCHAVDDAAAILRGRRPEGRS